MGSATIFGSDETRIETWTAIVESLATLKSRYADDNSKRLEKALAAFANIALMGTILFVLDRISDWTCDWWSQTCADVSKMLLFAYLAIFGYIGVYLYFLFNDQGRLRAAVAIGELWKEMMRLLAVYAELLQHTGFKDLPIVWEAATSGKGLQAYAEESVNKRKAAEEMTEAKKKS